MVYQMQEYIASLALYMSTDVFYIPARAAVSSR